MAKNIIFCADGTWNGPPADKSTAVDSSDERDDSSPSTPTNVSKLFGNFSGSVTEETRGLPNEPEKIHVGSDKQVLQVAKYIHGVGDSQNRVARFLGGAFGMGVIARIVRGYTFISRNYVPGDAIYVTGFSRGAYTARALAGMIAKVGLLNPTAYDPSDKDHAYALGISAWRKYREESLKTADLLTKLTNFVVDKVQGAAAKPLPPNGLIPDVPLKAVAVWDTVGSLGIPVYKLNGRVDVFRFADTALSDKVEHGFHAMAINEKRADFPVSKWDARSGVEQVWMLGAHADVGGGYPVDESTLSNIGLSWMMNKLGGVGAIFNKRLDFALDPDDLKRSLDFAFHTPWENIPFKGLATRARQIEKTDVLHDTVLKRLGADKKYALPGFDGLTPDDLAKFKTDDALYTA